MKRSPLVSILASIPLAACLQSGGGGEEEPAAALGTAEPVSLETYLKSALEAEIPTEPVEDGHTPTGVFVAQSPTAFTTTATGTSTDAATPRSAFDGATSSTNLQEAGVDEADHTKAGNGHLYVAMPQLTFGGWDSRRVAIQPVLGGPGLGIPIELTPVTGIVVLGDRVDFEPPPLEPARIRVLRLDESDPSAEEVATIELSERGTTVDGLYFLAADAEDARDVLVVIATGSPFGAYPADFTSTIHWENGRTTIHWIDVTDPSAPVEIEKLNLTGRVADSRRIGASLYVVSRHRASIRFDPWPRTPEAARENARLIDEARLEDLLPKMAMRDGREERLVHPRDCSILEDAEGVTPSAALTTITQVALRHPGRQRSSCLAGTVDTLYATTRSIYLTSTDFGYGVILPGGRRAGPHVRVHKFALGDDGAAYRATGRVPGFTGGRGAGESFRMGEHGDVLGVMTSIDSRHPQFAGRPGAIYEHRLTMLREAAGTERRLEEIARLPNEREPEPIGKPNEFLHGVRFVGDRVYVVTFRRIDPLYILDVSDPENPNIAGQIEIPGFSDYLHPVGDDLLLGVGLDTSPDVFNNWFRGVKVELFDVSDPTTLESLDHVVIGERRSSSSVLTDHHAFTYLADPTGARDRFALPVRRNATLPEGGDPDSATQYYDWTDTGLHLFELVHDDSPHIESVGVVVADAATDGEPGRYGSDTYDDRSVIQGDAVHYVHDEAVWSADWNDPAGTVGPH